MATTIEDIEKQITTLSKYIDGVSQVLVENVTSINTDLKAIKADIVILNAKVDKLDGNTTTNLKRVDGKIDDLKTEIKKIGTVTGYDDMINNLKHIK